jgi:hypothetical protein
MDRYFQSFWKPGRSEAIFTPHQKYGAIIGFQPYRPIAGGRMCKSFRHFSTHFVTQIAGFRLSPLSSKGLSSVGNYQ